MVKKLFQFLHRSRKEVLKYFIVGISSVILDMLTLIFLKEIMKLNAVLAISVNQIFVLFFNFCLNKYWTFKNFSLPHKQIFRYLTVAFINYCFAVVTMYFFHQSMGLDYRLVRMAAIAFMVCGNFLLSKYWVYHD